jgi:hypothetical protein
MITPHDITEILLKVVLNTIALKYRIYKTLAFFQDIYKINICDYTIIVRPCGIKIIIYSFSFIIVFVIK